MEIKKVSQALQYIKDEVGFEIEFVGATVDVLWQEFEVHDIEKDESIYIALDNGMKDLKEWANGCIKWLRRVHVYGIDGA